MSTSNSTPKPPATPAPPRVHAQKPSAPVNHPAVADYVQQWNQMAHENDRLKAENLQLRYDLEVSRNMVTELQHISDHERALKEKFQRWASRCDTLAGEVAAMAIQLRDECQRAAEPEPPAQIEAQPEAPPPPPEDEVDPALAALAKKLSPKVSYQ